MFAAATTAAFPSTSLPEPGGFLSWPRAPDEPQLWLPELDGSPIEERLPASASLPNGFPTAEQQSLTSSSLPNGFPSAEQQSLT